MQSTDSLPGDQKAVLQLVLGRGRSYDQIARMLSINPDAVRERALAALDALGPQTRVPEERRGLIADYLLGQLAEDRVPEARDLLGRSAPERAWARVVSAELETLANGPLPEIPTSAPASPASPPAPGVAAAPPGEPVPVPAAGTPGEGDTDDENLTWGDPDDAPESARPAGGGAGAAGRIAAAVGAGGAASAGAAAESAGGGRRGRRRGRDSGQRAGGQGGASGGPSGPRSSRLGGLLLIVLGIVIVAVILIVVLSSGGSSPRRTASAPTSASTTTSSTTPSASASASSSTTTTSASSSGAKVISQINLSPPAGTAGKIAGIAEVLKAGSSNEIAIVAQNVPANSTKPPNAYAVWLYNSPTSAHILGFVNPGVGSTGRLSTAGPLPSNAAQYKQVIVTLETNAQPKTPGKIILQGTLTGL
jgi:hypothetical protein